MGIALDRETDLCKREMIQDCRAFEGTPGGPEQLRSAMLHYVIRPALLPVISLDFLQLREYAVCASSPLPGYSAGVLVTENTPPSGQLEFEGWQLPIAKFGSVRVTQKTIKHFAASVEHLGCSSQTLVLNLAIPIPPRMAPLRLISNIILNTTLKTFGSFKSDVVDRWDEAGYKARMEKNKMFYGAVAAVRTGEDDATRDRFCGG